MNQVNELIIFILVLSQTFGFNYDEENESEKRIFGGSEASISDFPHQVIIQTEKYTLSLWWPYWVKTCEGSIIDYHHVLTAAHCVSPYRQQVVVAHGDANWFWSTRWEDSYEIKESYIHESFNPDKSRSFYDIAILRTRSPFIFSNAVAYVPIYQGKALVENDTDFKETGYFTIIGHGLSDWWWESLGYYRFRKGKMIPSKSYYKAHYFPENPPKYPLNMILVLTPIYDDPEGAMTAVGDSGSGLLVTIKGVDYLVGVASTNSQVGKFSTFGRVTYYFEWINEKIGLKLTLRE